MRIENRVLVAGTVGDIAVQAEFIIQKIEVALRQAGAKLRDVVRTRVFLAPDVEWEMVSRIHGKYFADIRPVHTLIYVHGLVRPDFKMEAEAIISPADV